MNTTEQSVDDLKALLEAAKKKERVEEDKVYQAKQKLRKEFLATRPYVYIVAEVKETPWGFDRLDVEVQDRIRVSQQIDIDAYDSFTHNRSPEEYAILSEEELDKVAGIQYYLTLDGIIHHSGGGTVVLKTPQLCSDQEWKQIKAGYIPTKFLRNGE